MAADESRNGPQGTRKARVFLSYSRKDKGFTHRLADALRRRGYVADFDQSEHDPDNIETGISAEDDWWKRLQEMIAAAEAMVFIVSPASASSPICDEEIAYARALGKRVIPLLLTPINFASAPPRLRALNVKLSFVEESTFETSLTALENVLDIDVAWHREAARLMALAVKWDSAGRPASQLMSSGAVAESEIWAAKRPGRAEPPGELLSDYLEASSEQARAHRDRLLQITGRAFVKPAEKALEERHYNLVLRLAAAATLLSEDLDLKLVPERARSAVLAASADHLRAIIPGEGRRVHCTALSPDRSLLAVAYSNSVCVLDTAEQTKIADLRGDLAEVSSIEFSPDGKRIVTSSTDGWARIWEAASGKQLIAIRAHQLRCNSATFSPEGDYVVTTPGFDGSGDHDARVWDASDGRERFVLRHESNVYRAAITSDGAYIVTASEKITNKRWDAKDKATLIETEGAAHLWDSASGRRILIFRGHGKSIHHVAVSPDGKFVFTSADNGTIKIWEVASGRELHCLQGVRPSAAPVICPNGKYIAAPSMDRLTRLWHVATGREIAVLRGHAGTNCVAFGPQSDQIATAFDDNTVATWDIASGRQVAAVYGRPQNTFRHETHNEITYSGATEVAFSASGHRIFAISAEGTVDIWDAANDGVIAALSGHTGPLESAVFSADDAHVLTGSDDGTARLWNASSGDELRVFSGHKTAVTSAAISPDGSRVVTSSSDGTAKIWAADSGRLIAELRGHKEWVSSAGFSPDGTQIVTSTLEDGDARIWDAVTGQNIARMRNTKSREGLSHAQYSHDATRIVTASTDGTARIWDIRSHGKIAELRGHEGWVTSASFSRDDSLIITSSHDDSARVWDAASGRQIALLKGHQGDVFFAQLSPDGLRAVTASSDRTARLWDVANEREIAMLGQHKSALKSAAFSADGARVVTASGDGMAQVWDVERSVHLIGDVSELIAASLSGRRGVLTEQDRHDLLLQAVSRPDSDLAAALIARLDERSPGTTQGAKRRSENLAKLYHPNCYKTPGTNGFKAPDVEVADVSAPHGAREKGTVAVPIFMQVVCFAFLVGFALWLFSSGIVAP
jgi:WD40 repeat protein